jgi:hypothetical protein
MNAATWKRLATRYMPELLDTFKLKGRLLYRRTVGDLLQGVLAEGSSFSSQPFVVEVFTQPLYVPSTYLILTWGGRLGTFSGGPERWWHLTAEDEAYIMDEVHSLLMTEGLPFLDRTNTPSRLVSYLDERNLPARTASAAEHKAYSLVLDGDVDGAVRAFAQLRTLAPPNPQLPYRKEVLERASVVLSALKTDPSQASNMLRAWAQESADRLGVGPVVDPENEDVGP